MVTMAEAMQMVMFFKSKQEEKGLYDRGNILQQKWDMRDVMSEVPPKDMKKLIRFFLDVDEDKTLQRFFMKYDEYYNIMQETIAERRRSRAAVKKTMEKISGE